MNEGTKKALLIVVAVVAVALAGWSAFNALSGDRTVPGVNNDLPPGSKTGKQLEMEAMQRGQQAGAQGGRGEEVDLGGAIGGRGEGESR